jgi:flavorubredoxin
MNMTIYPIPLGVDKAYIIQGESVVMIDGGAPKTAKAFIKAIKKSLIKPEDMNISHLRCGL